MADNMLDEYVPDEEVGSVEFKGWCGFYADTPADGWYMIQIEDTQGFKTFELIEGEMSARGRWAEVEREYETDYTEPGEEDIVIQDVPGGYDVGGREFTEYPTAVEFVREKCKSDSFWPDVWYMDDHGGFRKISEEVFPPED